MSTSLYGELCMYVQAYMPWFLTLILGDKYLLDLGFVESSESSGSVGAKQIRFVVDQSISLFRPSDVPGLVLNMDEWTKSAEEVVLMILYPPRHNINYYLSLSNHEDEVIENPFLPLSRLVEVERKAKILDELQKSLEEGEVSDVSEILKKISPPEDILKGYSFSSDDVRVVLFKRQHTPGIPYDIWVRVKLKNGEVFDAGGVDIWDALRRLHANLSVV